MNTAKDLGQAPTLETQAWIGTNAPIQLSELKGKVVVILAFQMLCPGCISHGIPQAIRVHKEFSGANLQVIGLHTVFEHHEVMNLELLKAFTDEYRTPFPVAIDKTSTKGKVPRTMEKYQMRGTPTLARALQSA